MDKYTSEALKKQLKVTGFALIFMLFMTFVAYCLSAGALIVKPLDLSYLDDTNIMRLAGNIESCNVLTARVVGLDDYELHRVEIRFDEDPNIIAGAYLSERDFSKLELGDVITLRGQIQYTHMDDSTPTKDDPYKHGISIGSIIPTFPFSFYAQIVEIER